VHPNDTGYGKMAAVWLAALNTLLAALSDPDRDRDGDVDGSDLAAYILNDRGLSLTDFAASFGYVNEP
jgi:hypothetical protein